MCIRAQKGTKNKSAERLSPGGWDKCLGPFSDKEASEYGVDVWKCRSYCYTRRDPNGGLLSNTNTNTNTNIL